MKADLTRTARNQDGQQVTVCVRLCQTGTERDGVVIDLTRSGFTQSEDARPNRGHFRKRKIKHVKPIDVTA